MKLWLSACFASFFISVASGEPTITNVTARQRYPWNGKVDISYTVTGGILASVPQGMSLLLKVAARDMTSGQLFQATTLDGDTSLSDGRHSIVWDMEAQGLNFISTNVVFTVSCEPEPTSTCQVLAESALAFGVMYVRSLISCMGYQKFMERFCIGSIERLDTSALQNYGDEYKNGVYFTVVSGHAASGSLADIIKVNVHAISLHRESGVARVVRKNLDFAFSSLNKFAVFYTRDLEVWPGENMTINGKVHSNGNLYIGADKLIRFDKNVTAHGKFYAQRKPGSGYGDNAYVTARDRVQFRRGDDEQWGNSDKTTAYVDVIRQNANGTTRMDSSGLGSQWASQSEEYYQGAVRTDQMKLAPPISVNDNEHTIIERILSPSNPNYNKDTKAIKFANKAAMTIRIDSNGNLHLYNGKYVEGTSENEIPNPERLMQPAVSKSKPSNETGKYYVTRKTCTYISTKTEKNALLHPSPLTKSTM